MQLVFRLIIYLLSFMQLGNIKLYIYFWRISYLELRENNNHLDKAVLLTSALPVSIIAARPVVLTGSE